MKIYFVRHGESEANVTNEFSNQSTRHPLTDKGRAQVAALADTLRDVKFAAIYSSPLLRARQTAEILSTHLGMPFTIVDALREHHAGELEGTFGEASWERYRNLIKTWMFAQDFEARIPGGESFNDLKQRFMPFWAQLQEKHAPTHDTLLLVGHGGLYHFILPLLFSNMGYALSAKYLLDNTAYVVAELRAGAWVCVKWGEADLQAA